MPSDASDTTADGGALLDGLACPRCAGSLVPDGGPTCGSCGTSYFTAAGVPCLVPEPASWRARAVQQLDEYLEFIAARVDDLERTQAAPVLLPRTRERLGRIIAGANSDRALVATTLEPLRDGSLTFPPAGTLSGAPAAGTLELLGCYENVFRDWAWGDDESARALRLVQGLTAQAGATLPVDRTAVFGAGAGRLAVDLHRALAPTRTLALDLNPLPLFIANRLARGEIIEALEFPVAPRTEREVTVRRRLQCAGAVPPGLTFVVADARCPPFAPGSLDLVVTPWFIDAVAADPRATAAVLSNVLRKGGLWINFGPLRFGGHSAGLYTIEELLEIVAGSGFDVVAECREQVPYFASPDSGFHRSELVYGFVASKQQQPDRYALVAPAQPPECPGWIDDPAVAIPVLPLWASIRRTAVVAEGVLSLIDGHSSISDLSNTLGQSWGVTPRTLDAQLQAFLSRLLPS